MIFSEHDANFYALDKQVIISLIMIFFLIYGHVGNPRFVVIIIPLLSFSFNLIFLSLMRRLAL